MASSNAAASTSMVSLTMFFSTCSSFAPMLSRLLIVYLRGDAPSRARNPDTHFL